MSLKKLLLATCGAVLATGSALADDGMAATPPQSSTQPYYTPSVSIEPASRIWYMELHGGAVWQDDNTFDSFGTIFVTNLDKGWAGGGAMGYRYDTGFRFEFEGTWRDNDGVIVGGAAPGVSPAQVRALNLMMNGLFDFDTGSFFTPYLGAGAGAARVSMEFNFPPGTDKDHGWAFAYQFIGGVTVPIPNTLVEIYADYRYLRTEGLKLFDVDVQNHDEYASHTVMGGLVFNF